MGLTVLVVDDDPNTVRLIPYPGVSTGSIRYTALIRVLRHWSLWQSMSRI